MKQPSSPDSDLLATLVRPLLYENALHLILDADFLTSWQEFDLPVGGSGPGLQKLGCLIIAALGCLFSLILPAGHWVPPRAFPARSCLTWSCRHLAPCGSNRHHGALRPLARVGPTGTLPTDSRAISGPSTRATTRAWWGRAQGPFGPCTPGPRGKRPGESAWPKFGLAASPLQSRLPRPGPQ